MLKMLLEATIGVNFKESKIFTKCNGTKVQSKALEFIEGQWKVNASLRDINHHPDLGVKMYKIRLFDADGSTYLGIKESGKTIEIVVQVGTFSLEIANGMYLQFDVKELEDDDDEDNWDCDNNESDEEEDEDDWDCDDESDEEEDDDDWDCDDDEEDEDD